MPLPPDGMPEFEEERRLAPARVATAAVAAVMVVMMKSQSLTGSTTGSLTAAAVPMPIVGTRFAGGRVDSVMRRIVDMAYAVPYLLIAILVVTVFGRDILLVVAAIAAFSWLDMARVVRGQTLSIKSREFVEAARAIGVPTWRIIFQHVVPNLMGVVVIYTSIVVPGVILSESVLSFLGLGVQEPMTSWGVLIHDGAAVMGATPWMILFPAAALSITLYCANFIGDGLRDALDPKDR